MNLVKQKLKASGIHFIISLFFISISLLLALKFWYPAPFFEISGLDHIILILITVDVILGPLLTLVVFKPKKPSLKIDLTIIGLVQIVAFCYGFYTIYSAHPLYIAFAGDRFTPINTNEVDPAKAKYPELKKSKLTGPTLVYVQKPSDPSEVSRLTMEVLSGKPDLDTRPEYYEPFKKFTDTMLTKSINPEVFQRNNNNKQQLNNFLAKHGKQATDYVFLALSGKERDVLWAFNSQSWEPIDIIDINPFGI